MRLGLTQSKVCEMSRVALAQKDSEEGSTLWQRLYLDNHIGLVTRKLHSPGSQF